jgi:hypothetical protein
MIRPTNALILIVVAGFAAVLPGCFDVDDGAGTRYPVRGRVTYQGKPLAKGVISFIPDGDSGRGALGEIVNGTITNVSTFALNDGMLPGTYALTLASFQRVGTAHQRTKHDRSHDGNGDEDDGTLTMGVNVLPKKYSLPESSGLRFRVEQRPTRLTIDLQD